MDIATIRKELGLSQEAFAARLGLKSKGHVSVMEAGKPPSLRVAIELERISGGRLRAADMNSDVAFVLAHLQDRALIPSAR